MDFRGSEIPDFSVNSFLSFSNWFVYLEKSIENLLKLISEKNMRTKLLIGLETIVYVSLAFLLEYLIDYPWMALHHGKDGGLISEVEFMLIITLFSMFFSYRNHIAVLIISWVFSPVIMLFSFLIWGYLLDVSGIGLLLLYIVLMLLYKLFIVPKLFKEQLKQ